MKYLVYWCIVVTCLVACKKEDPGPTAEEEYLSKIGFTWELTRATVDGKDVTSQFSGFAVTWKTDKTYAIENGPQPMWRAAGTFELKEILNSTNCTVILDDADQVDIVELSATSMAFEFTWNAPAARTTSITGEYRFEMEKVQ